MQITKFPGQVTDRAEVGPGFHHSPCNLDFPSCFQTPQRLGFKGSHFSHFYRKPLLGRPPPWGVCMFPWSSLLPTFLQCQWEDRWPRVRIALSNIHVQPVSTETNVTNRKYDLKLVECRPKSQRGYLFTSEKLWALGGSIYLGKATYPYIVPGKTFRDWQPGPTACTCSC